MDIGQHETESLSCTKFRSILQCKIFVMTSQTAQLHPESVWPTLLLATKPKHLDPSEDYYAGDWDEQILETSNPRLYPNLAWQQLQCRDLEEQSAMIAPV